MEPIPAKIKMAHFRSAKGKRAENKKVKVRKQLRDAKTRAEKATLTEKEAVATPPQWCQV